MVPPYEISTINTRIIPDIMRILTVVSQIFRMTASVSIKAAKPAGLQSAVSYRRLVSGREKQLIRFAGLERVLRGAARQKDIHAILTHRIIIVSLDKLYYLIADNQTNLCTYFPKSVDFTKCSYLVNILNA